MFSYFSKKSRRFAIVVQIYVVTIRKNT